MDEIKSLEEYDNELFDIFQTSFSSKYPDIFENKKLYNTWGRKCNFILKSLKNTILKDEKNPETQKSIKTLLDFLTDKGNNTKLKHLSSFNCDLFENYSQEILDFRNGISELIFDFIVGNYRKNKDSFTVKIQEGFNIYFQTYGFLKSLFDLIEYALDNSVDIYKEYLLLLNNDDIIQQILVNKNCTLNSNQKKFITLNKYDLANSSSFLNKLKEITISNDELIQEINNFNINQIHIDENKNKNFSKNIKEKNETDEPSDKKKLDTSSHSENNKTEVNDNTKKDKVNISNKEIGVTSINKIDNTNNNYEERITNLELKNAKLLQEIECMKKTIKNISLDNDELKNRIKNISLDNDELKNRIDICETKISMICYRDLIKDIINYSFKYFNITLKGKNGLLNKVNGIKDLLNSSKKIGLNSDEKGIYSIFIYISYLILKNVNHNVYDNDGNYISDYSISNFIKCLKDYMDLYSYDVLYGGENVDISDLNKIYSNMKVVENVLNKIGFSYEDEFN